MNTPNFPGIEVIPCHEPERVARLVGQFVDAMGERGNLDPCLKILHSNFWNCNSEQTDKMSDILTAFSLALMIVNGTDPRG